MNEDIYYQVRDKYGCPVGSPSEKLSEVLSDAKRWIKDFPNSYKVTNTQPWGLVKITVKKMRVLNYT